MLAPMPPYREISEADIREPTSDRGLPGIQLLRESPIALAAIDVTSISCARLQVTVKSLVLIASLMKGATDVARVAPKGAPRALNDDDLDSQNPIQQKTHAKPHAGFAPPVEKMRASPCSNRFLSNAEVRKAWRTGSSYPTRAFASNSE